MAQDGGSGEICGAEKAQGFVEFGGESSGRIVLGDGFGQMLEIFDKPSGAGSSEGLIYFGFIERQTRNGDLMIDGAGVHAAGELHDGTAEIGIAGENGGFDGRCAAILRQEGRMEIEDTFGLEKFKKVGFNKHAKRSQDGVRLRKLALQFGGLGEIGGGARVKNDIEVVLEDGEGGGGEGSVAEKDYFR